MMTDGQVAAQVCVASVVPGTPSTAICSGLPVHRGLAHPPSHGHQVTRDDLRRIDPGSGRAGDGSTQGSRPARLRGVEQAHARLSGSGAAIADAGRRDQRRVWLSRSEMPWLQHASDGCPRHRAATETTPVHELELYMSGRICRMAMALRSPRWQATPPSPVFTYSASDFRRT
jgi:hypothetical protein